MSKVWQVQEAKARFSELLETSLAEGPQIVTKRGVETAVLVPIDQWRRLERMTRPNLKELLLAPEPRTEALTPPRRPLRRRAVPAIRLARVSPRYQRRLRTAAPAAKPGCAGMDSACAGRSPLSVSRHDRRDPGRYRSHPPAGRRQGGTPGMVARPRTRDL